MRKYRVAPWTESGTEACVFKLISGQCRQYRGWLNGLNANDKRTTRPGAGVDAKDCLSKVNAPASEHHPIHFSFQRLRQSSRDSAIIMRRWLERCAKHTMLPRRGISLPVVSLSPMLHSSSADASTRENNGSTLESIECGKVSSTIMIDIS